MATQPKDFDIFKTIKNVVYCPECNEDPPNIGEEFSSGHLVCMSCGLVCGENIVDTRSEWRTFSNDDKPGADRNRVGDGGNPLLSGGQLYTKVGDGRGGHGTMVALSRTQQKVTKDKPNEKLLEIYTVIEAFCAYGKLNSTVVDASKHVAKLAIEGKWFPTFTEPVVCAIIFEGCKRGGESRNMKEIGRLSGKKTVFNRQLAMVNKKLTSGSQGDIDTNTGASRATFAKDLMPRYCQEIGLPVWAETLAVQVAEAVDDTLILGSRTARNVAASVIYLVCHLIGQPRTVTEIYSLAEQVKGKYSPINMIPI